MNFTWGNCGEPKLNKDGKGDSRLKWRWGWRMDTRPPLTSLPSIIPRSSTPN